MKKNVLLIFSVLLVVSLSAQQNEYATKVFVSPARDSLLYRELVPEKVIEGEKYPLVLFLHGAGERGNNNESQLVHGGNMFTNPVNRENYPAYVLFPQCPADHYWALRERPANFQGNPFPQYSEITPSLNLVTQLLNEVLNIYPIDTDRIYVVGLSMGGMGTFDMVCRNPDLFAAAVPICGGVNIDRLKSIRTRTHFRIFHGDADSVVPVVFSRDAYRVLKENQMSVEYIEFPGVNHDSWTSTFNKPDFMEWLFRQKK